MRVLFFILKILLFSIIVEKSSAKIEIQYKINNNLELLPERKEKD